MIIAANFPTSFAQGFLYLIAYAASLALVSRTISLLGQAVIDCLNWLRGTHGTFRKVIGVIFIAIGLGVVFGLDQDLQSWILENGWYDPVKPVDDSLS